MLYLLLILFIIWAGIVIRGDKFLTAGRGLRTVVSAVDSKKSQSCVTIPDL